MIDAVDDNEYSLQQQGADVVDYEDGEDQQEDLPSTSDVIARIEHLTRAVINDLDDGKLPLLSSLSLKAKKSFAFDKWNQCRSFTSILLVLSYCHSLLLAGRTTTTREVYYYYVTHFRSQRECDAAIWNAVELLGVERHDLGLLASPRGWFCGDVQLWDENGDLILDGRKLMSTQGSPISTEWLSLKKTKAYTVSTESAACVFVIEKEGIYQRLSEDKFFEDYPCILVTGKGFPDLATRAMVHHLHNELGLPVRGLADCNPFGVMVLQTYQGSGRGCGFGVPVEWLGLRPSQVQELSRNEQEDVAEDHKTDDGDAPRPVLPDQVFQSLTAIDQKRLDEHLLKKTYGWTQDDATRELRIEEMVDMENFKVELEALHWLGMDFCAQWVGGILNNQDKRRQQQADGYESDTEDPLWLQVI